MILGNKVLKTLPGNVVQMTKPGQPGKIVISKAGGNNQILNRAGQQVIVVTTGSTLRTIQTVTTTKASKYSSKLFSFFANVSQHH